MEDNKAKDFGGLLLLVVTIVCAVCLTILLDYGFSSAEDSRRLSDYLEQDFIGDHTAWVGESGTLGAFDPNAPDIRFDFPPTAVHVPVEVRAFRTELPADVPPPANGVVGAPFYFGAWIKGAGRTVSEFYQSVVITVEYEASALPETTGMQQSAQSMVNVASSHLGQSTGMPFAMAACPAAVILLPHASPVSDPADLSPIQEERLRLSMYDPSTQSWVKLCSRVDKYANKVSAAILLPTPTEEGGNTLFAVTVDDTPALKGVVDDQGNTTLSIPGSNLSLGVLAGTVAVGTYFEVTRLPDVPESYLFKMLPTFVDIKACRADYTAVNKIVQITEFSKPIEIEFDFDASTLRRAGGRANLTIVSLQDRQWVDMEEFGLRVVRSDTTIGVDTGDLGIFGMAAR